MKLYFVFGVGIVVWLYSKMFLNCDKLLEVLY